MSNNQDYNQVADRYSLTHAKPDKRYSIWPTVQRLVGDVVGKTIFDAGCGDGFFTVKLAELGARSVIGWDISTKQIERAIANQPDQPKTIDYSVSDIFTDELPHVDCITAPFVLNYAENTDQLSRLLERFYAALQPDGRLIGVIDLPTGQDLSKYGARKRLLGPKTDGTPIEIATFDGANNKLLTLPLLAHYYSQTTFTTLLEHAGFAVTWHQPVISQAGMKRFGQLYWKDYVKNPELGYFVATKKVGKV